MDSLTPSIEILSALRQGGHERIATVTLRLNLDDRPLRIIAGAEAKSLIDGQPASVAQRVPRARIEAFSRVGVTPSHVVSCETVTREDGHAAGMVLLSLPVHERPTAIVCQADVYAWGVSDAARELGLRVPEDVSIAGFDGLLDGVFGDLNLTTVMQDGATKGRLLARWLTRASTEPDAPPPFDLPLTVRWGSTSGPAPA